MTLRQKLVVATGLILGLGIFSLAFVFGGDDTSDILIDGNPALEAFIPARGDQVELQDDVGLDVAEGWEARIISINGTPIPKSQQIFNPSFSIVTFAPGEGKALAQLQPGTNEVVARYWQIVFGESDARDVNWIFTAT